MGGDPEAQDAPLVERRVGVRDGDPGLVLDRRAVLLALLGLGPVALLRLLDPALRGRAVPLSSGPDTDAGWVPRGPRAGTNPFAMLLRRVWDRSGLGVRPSLSGVWQRQRTVSAVSARSR